ncbi:MAG: hypothetical protein Q8S73_28445 [Deltaproteobacteria bacterium]|nr:hypothetical protein [Myxococcales bacterium]MDP3218069.1 hypothetical protein [Deltaproteobacteria bacterium]
MPPVIVDLLGILRALPNAPTKCALTDRRRLFASSANITIDALTLTEMAGSAVSVATAI